MEFLFLYFPMPIDNNIWYARVGIFNCLMRYVSPTVRHCRDINFFINLLNKSKSYLALFLPFLIFCFGVELSSRESLYRELGLECLQTRRWYRKMIFFYKILNGLAPKYLFDILPVSKNRHYSFRNQSNLELSQFFSTKVNPIWHFSYRFLFFALV